MRTSRRAILGAAVAAGALTGAAAGTAIATHAWSKPTITPVVEPDPIFDLIERHRVAYEAHGEACKAADAAEPGTIEYALADAQQTVACNADCDAMRAIALTVPTTFAGAAAMLRYLIDFEADGNIALGICMRDDDENHSCVADALLATLVKFMEARA